MTVAELQAALQAAVERGLDPDTTVVVATEGWFSIVDYTVDPSVLDSDQADMWFTLFPGDDADARFTPGGRPGTLEVAEDGRVYYTDGPT